LEIPLLNFSELDLKLRLDEFTLNQDHLREFPSLSSFTRCSCHPRVPELADPVFGVEYLDPYVSI